MSVYDKITEKVIKSLNEGRAPWICPYDRKIGHARSGITGNRYSRLNEWLLEEGGRYFTFKACQDRGLHVKKGSHGRGIVFTSLMKAKDEHGDVILDKDGDEKMKRFLKWSVVFHEKDIDGMDAEEEPVMEPCEASAVIADYLKRTGIRLEDKWTTPCYCKGLDTILMPPRSKFTSDAGYYASLLHELAHSTGHCSRLNREGGFWASKEYAAEELVAEMAAAELCQRCGIAPAIENSASYCASWAQVLGKSSAIFVRAATQAQKAVDMIIGTKEGNMDK